jgi:hypothetical protein
MHKSFSLVAFHFVFFFLSSSAWSQNTQNSQNTAPQAALTCPQWNEVKPMVQNLQRVVACGPQYTTNECRENIGYGGAVGVAKLAGRSVGAMAGRNIQIAAPTVCGIAGLQDLRGFFFESVAWAGCNPQVQVKDGAGSIAKALQASNSVREAELGNYLTQKLANENPELNKMSRSVIQTFTKDTVDDSYIAKVKELNEKLKPLGVSIPKMGKCTGNEEVCAKLWALAYSQSHINTKDAVAGNADRLMAYYAFDPQVSAYKDNISRSNDLLRRVQKGLVSNESELEDLFKRAGSVTHPAAKSMLTDSANFISRTLPALGKKQVFAEAGTLAKSSAEYLAKNGKHLGRILPFGLASLVGVATGANASEVAVDLLPPIVKIASPISTGCSGRYSRYAPLNPDSSRCEPVEQMTPDMVDFLTLPEAQQQAEVCSFQSLEQTLKKMNFNYFPPGMSLACNGSNVTIKTDFKDRQFFAQFDYKDDNLMTARVSKKMDGLTGYEYNLDPDLGKINSGKLISSRAFTPIKKGVNLSDLKGTAEDFSSRQVLAHMGKDCCSQGSQDSCSAFKAGVNKGGGDTEGTDSGKGIR